MYMNDSYLDFDMRSANVRSVFLDARRTSAVSTPQCCDNMEKDVKQQRFQHLSRSRVSGEQAVWRMTRLTCLSSISRSRVLSRVVGLCAGLRMEMRCFKELHSSHVPMKTQHTLLLLIFINFLK
jgi:hypothetical protein